MLKKRIKMILCVMIMALSVSSLVAGDNFAWVVFTSAEKVPKGTTLEAQLYVVASSVHYTTTENKDYSKTEAGIYIFGATVFFKYVGDIPDEPDETIAAFKRGMIVDLTGVTGDISVPWEDTDVDPLDLFTYTTYPANEGEFIKSHITVKAGGATTQKEAGSYTVTAELNN